MFTTTVIVTVVLAALLMLSATMKAGHSDAVVRFYERVGVPEDKLNYLALVLLAGAAGLLLGLFWPPIGIAAAVGVICYFAGAIAFHLRARDLKGLPNPVLLLAMGVAALVLRLTTMA